MALDKDGVTRLPKGITWRSDKSLYMVRFTYQGQSHTFYEKDLRKAKKTLADKRYEVEHGLTGKADKITLGKWYEVWLAKYKIPTVKETTVNTYKATYRGYIESALGHRFLAKIKPVDIQELINALRDDGLAPKTISCIYGVLVDLFKYACDNDLIVKTPCRNIKLPSKGEAERRVLTVREQDIFFAYLQRERFLPYAPLFKVMLGTGIRIGEALGLTWDCVDFEKKKIYIKRTIVYVKDIHDGAYRFKFQSPKTATSKREIKLNGFVEDALRRQRISQAKLRLYVGSDWQPLDGDFGNLVFLNFKGRPFQTCDIQNILNRLAVEINADETALAMKEQREPILMEHIHPHCLRHTFATRAIEQGMKATTLQKILGHASLSMTVDLYVHTTEETMWNEMKLVEQAFVSA